MLSSHPLERRRLIQLAAVGAASLWLPRGTLAQRRWSANPFSLGVASGSPATDSVVLWTRLMAPAGIDRLGRSAIPVKWEVAHDEQFARIVQRGEAPAMAELAHSVHAEVPGLEPDRWYFYRFIAGDAVSATGRTRTLPTPEAAVQKLRIAYASCQRWDQGYFSAWKHMLAENLDAVLFLGDYIYEYPGGASAVRVAPGGYVDSLEGYRRRYALHRSDAALQAMHAACPWIVTWDDHEVQNDYAGVNMGGGSTAPLDDPSKFAVRRAAAYQAYYEHMPLRASTLTRAVAGLQSGAELRIYSRLRFGQLATLHLLDARQYKDPQVCTKDGRPGSGVVDPATCESWADPRRTMLGTEQERWLDEGLSMPQGWSVIGQQSLFGQRDGAFGARQSFWNDGWDGYGAARSRLTASLQKHRGADTVMLGGDVHENWVGHIKSDYSRPESNSLGVEFCGTSITSRSAGNARVPSRLARNPHFIFADAERKGYGVAEFTPRQMTATLRVVDDVTQPETKIETLAKFAVQRGRPVLEKA